MPLFDDDEDDFSGSENHGKLVSDFKLKLRFEGEKGKKVIQSTSLIIYVNISYN